MDSDSAKINKDSQGEKPTDDQSYQQNSSEFDIKNNQDTDQFVIQADKVRDNNSITIERIK